MTSALAPEYVHGIYIPSALLIVGVAIVKMEWLLYAIVLTAVLAGWKFYTTGEHLIAFKTPLASHCF